jgi:outer membrane protein assembly factor BamA
MKMSFIFCFYVLILGLIAYSQEDTVSAAKRSFMVVPVLDYNQSAGMRLGVFAAAFYKPVKSDTVSPLSQTGIVTFYSTKKNYAFIGLQRLFWACDKNRLVAAAGLAETNFQVYNDEFIPGGAYIPYNTGNVFAYAEYQRKIFNRFYAGALASYVHTKTEFNTGTDSYIDEGDYFGPGLVLSHDSRDNVYSATKGLNASIKSTFSWEALGSTTNYVNTDVYANYYHPFKNNKLVLAMRLALALANGNVPFQSLNIVGGKDIRGYTKGTYRGKQRYAIQSEIRYTFIPRFGFITFAGLALTSNNGEDSSPLLPAAGAGIRYLMLPKEKINIGIEAAAGKNDFGIYFRIGEAF